MLQTIGNALEIKASGGPKEAQDSEKKPKVANAVHHECFLGRVGRAVSVVPETNKQIGTHPHQLPEHINLEQVGTNNQPEHRAAEKGEIGEKSNVALVVGHISVGIHHHQQGNGGDQRQHHRAQWVNDKPHGQCEVARTGPDEQMFDRWRTG